MSPLISVIVPVYKVEKYLAKCVDSAVNQTYKNLEIILVDDGSPDNCGKICDDYAVKDRRVKVIHKANGGLVSARNAGYDVITGEWHMYVDGDDWIDLETCEKLVEQINKNADLDLIFWHSVQEFNAQSISGKNSWDVDDYTQLYQGIECRELCRRVNDYRYGIAPAFNKLIRSGYARKCGIRHDDRLRQGMEGAEFALRAFYYAKRVLFINKHFYHYRYVANSISKKPSEKNSKYIIECLKVMEENIQHFENPQYFFPTFLHKTSYVLIAIAMSTYFNPNNEEGYHTRKRKFNNLINNFPLFGKALEKIRCKDVGKFRGPAFFCIKHRFYLGLEFIGFAKQFMLKLGFFGY